MESTKERSRPVTMTCPDCEGEGGVMLLCSSCRGSGEGPADGTRCRTCHGPGELPKQCTTCDGSGQVDAIDLDEVREADGDTFETELAPVPPVVFPAMNVAAIAASLCLPAMRVQRPTNLDDLFQVLA